MNLNEATNLVNEYINKFIPGTVFAGFISSKIVFGKAGIKSGVGIIKLSKPYVLSASDESIRDTIAHEVAHILSYRKFGTLAHDRHFYRMCLVTGATPERCSNQEANNQALKGSYGFVIIDNDEVTHVLSSNFHRRPRKDMTNRFLLDRPRHETLGKIHYCKIENAKVGKIKNKNDFWQK